jgi:hypothetical protein
VALLWWLFASISHMHGHLRRVLAAQQQQHTRWPPPSPTQQQRQQQQQWGHQGQQTRQQMQMLQSGVCSLLKQLQQCSSCCRLLMQRKLLLRPWRMWRACTCSCVMLLQLLRLLMQLMLLQTTQVLRLTCLLLNTHTMQMPHLPVCWLVLLVQTPFVQAGARLQRWVWTQPLPHSNIKPLTPHNSSSYCCNGLLQLQARLSMQLQGQRRMQLQQTSFRTSSYQCGQSTPCLTGSQTTWALRWVSSRGL